MADTALTCAPGPPPFDSSAVTHTRRVRIEHMMHVFHNQRSGSLSCSFLIHGQACYDNGQMNKSVGRTARAYGRGVLPMNMHDTTPSQRTAPSVPERRSLKAVFNSYTSTFADAAPGPSERARPSGGVRRFGFVVPFVTSP